MISHHNTHSKIWKEIYGFYFNKELPISFPLRPGRNYAVVLCKNARVNLLFLFWTMCNSVNGPYDIKSLKILTAYEISAFQYEA